MPIKQTVSALEVIQEGSGETFPSGDPVLYLASIGVALIGVAPRIIAVFNDFWLDEIWSWNLSQSVARPELIFTSIQHDNNHWLVTLYMHLVGDQPWHVYRLPSLAAGIGSLPLAWLIGRQSGKVEALLATTLVSFSYLQIHYASEARGYSLAAFFSLLCVFLMLRQTQSYSGFRAIVFSTAASFGLLSHLTFVFAYAGLLAWSSVGIPKRQPNWIRGVTAWLLHHVAPLWTISFLYWINIRHMQIGGGDRRPIIDVLREVAAWTTGAPILGVALAVVTAMLVVALFAEVILNRTQRFEECLCFAIAIFIVPCLAIMFSSEAIYPRYFLISALFALMLFAKLLTRCFKKKGAASFAAVIALALFCIGNAIYTRDFLRDGRGQYLAALDYLCVHSSEGKIVVGSTHDFRSFTVLSYYVRFLPNDKEVIYVTRDQWQETIPEWILFNQFHWEPRPESQLSLSNDVQYSLEAEFPYAGASGWTWLVYHRRR